MSSGALICWFKLGPVFMEAGKRVVGVGLGDVLHGTFEM